MQVGSWASLSTLSPNHCHIDRCKSVPGSLMSLPACKLKHRFVALGTGQMIADAAQLVPTQLYRAVPSTLNQVMDHQCPNVLLSQLLRTESFEETRVDDTKQDQFIRFATATFPWTVSSIKLILSSYIHLASTVGTLAFSPNLGSPERIISSGLPLILVTVN